MLLLAFIIHLSSYWLSVLYLYKYDKAFVCRSIENWNKYKKAIKISLLNQFGITLPLALLMKNNLLYSIHNNTSLYDVYSTSMILLTSGLLFYIFHRILHISYFYNKIHKIHHEFIIPVAPASLYAHPIEHILCNNISFLIPFTIFGTSRNISILLIIFASLMITTSHVDYNFPYMSYSHILHHKKYKYNYGFGDIFDKLFGTFYKNK
jgi:sterol desaturase/sphingolipid hydroxylase (fatty acid hydroxylase superfamily)